MGYNSVADIRSLSLFV